MSFSIDAPSAATPLSLQPTSAIPSRPQTTASPAASSADKVDISPEANAPNVQASLPNFNRSLGSSAGDDTDFSPSPAVNLARQFNNRLPVDIRGQMPNFQAAGGLTNDCADFVSSALQATGGLDKHQISVKGLEKELQKEKYTQVPADKAQPGDVWISNKRQHTELVSQPGGTKTIGSNNYEPGHQRVSERDKALGTGVYYHRDNPTAPTPTQNDAPVMIAAAS